MKTIEKNGDPISDPISGMFQSPPTSYSWNTKCPIVGILDITL